MWSLNIFWTLIFIISKHYAAGSMLNPVVKTVQKAYTDKRQELQSETNKMQNMVNGALCRDDDPYRTMDGTCNNLKKVGLGAAGTPYGRFWENSYSDGIEELPFCRSDDCYRSAREMSLELYSNKKKPDEKYTLCLVPFGQFVVHDFILGRLGTLVTCCDNGKYTSNQETHPKCDAIGVPKDDPVFGAAGVECMNFVRQDTNGCEPADPISVTTHYIDGSQIYGNNDQTARSLRTGSGGKMLSVQRNGKEWLPQSMDPTQACFNVTDSNKPCYRAGDPRVNQNTALTMMHIIFLRCHNDIAEKLCGHKSCTWDDEECYQRVRRIIIALLQKIFYHDYLTIIMGQKYMYKHKLIYKKSCRDEDGYVNDYSCDCDPSITVECATAALRGQHSAIPEHFNLYFEDENCENKKRCDEDYFDVRGSIEMSRFMNRPYIIEKGNNSVGLSRGLHVQCQESVDRHFVDGIRHEMFSQNIPLSGEDLAARDVARGRDHGVPSYCTAALECGLLTKCTCFDDIRKYISDKNVDRLERLYCGDVSKVELMVGGMLEEKVSGTLVGPVFQCILGKQFLNSRCGDRYWYEGSNQPFAFSPEQLENIRQITLASILCQYGDGIDKIQENVFKKISKKNPLRNCCDLPTLDCTLFQDYEKK